MSTLVLAVPLKGTVQESGAGHQTKCLCRYKSAPLPAAQKRNSMYQSCKRALISENAPNSVLKKVNAPKNAPDGRISELDHIAGSFLACGQLVPE